MKNHINKLFGAVIFLVLMLAFFVTIFPTDSPSIKVDGGNYTKIGNPSGCTIYRLEYQGKVYLINNQGGIIEHKPTLEK